VVGLGERGVGGAIFRADDLVLADGHGVDLDLIEDALRVGVWPDSRSNRSARAAGESAKRTAKRRSTQGASHLGAEDPARRAAIDGDRSEKRSKVGARMCGW
jgi:hypothetical protein